MACDCGLVGLKTSPQEPWLGVARTKSASFLLGRVSVTSTSTAVSGPLLPTVTVKVISLLTMATTGAVFWTVRSDGPCVTVVTTHCGPLLEPSGSPVALLSMRAQSLMVPDEPLGGVAPDVG